MADINELKTLIIEQGQRISALESIVASLTTYSPPANKDSQDRTKVHIHDLIILKREGEKCICGVQTKRTDKYVPLIELNFYNLKAIIVDMEKALRRGEDRILIENYKQHNGDASYLRGEWEINE